MRVFNARTVETSRKIGWIRETDKEISRAFLRETSVASRTLTEKIVKLCWKPSLTHQFTLNVDGSVKTTMRTAGIGGILRNAQGEWAGGFSANSDQANPTVTEMHAIVKAMQWAWNKGIRDIEVQSDASEAVKWIRERANLRGIARDLAQEAIRWCARDWNISIRDIFREQNRSADALAMLGTYQTVGWKDFSSCPPECEEVYFNDFMRAKQVRRVRETSQLGLAIGVPPPCLI